MADDGVDDIFVYLGGDQEVPFDVVHVVIDRSVNIILRGAFDERRELVSVETHEGIEKVEEYAFYSCTSLRKMNLIGVREIKCEAFYGCAALADVEFGDKLETIRDNAFGYCNSLQKIKMSSVRTIEAGAFSECEHLSEAEFGGNVETIGALCFDCCPNLRRIAIPLKDDIFPLPSYSRRCNQFDYCRNLKTVDLVGGERIHKFLSSLFLQSWRDEMNQEIDQIYRVLPNTPSNEKTDTIRQWITSLLGKMEHYRSEHYRLLKQTAALLDLAIWKVKLDEKEDSLEGSAKRAKLNDASIRKEQRVTSGASIVIKNVLPFLKLE